MKVRSGFKKNHRGSKRSTRPTLRFMQQKAKRILSSPVLHDLFSGKVFKKNRPKKRSSRSYLKRDIAKKEFVNPYQKPSKKRISGIKQAFAKHRFNLSLGVLAVISLAWFITIFVQPTFYVKKIAFSGLSEIPEDQLREILDEQLNKRSLLLIKRSHLFFLSESRIEQAISERYGLESIQFKSHWPSNSMLITLKEKASVLAYNVNDAFFTMDKTGAIIKSLDQDSIAQQPNTPLIYQYGEMETPTVGQTVMTQEQIKTLLDLYDFMQTTDGVTIHSFRLKPVEKRTVVIPEANPIVKDSDDVVDDILQENLDDLATSIANAQTVEEKISQIKSALDDIPVEQLEEGEIERYLEAEKRYEPDDSIQFQELEIYTVNGWSIKLGTKIFQDQTELERVQNIFATLNGKVDLSGEVKEYIDLRFPNRVYYR